MCRTEGFDPEEVEEGVIYRVPCMESDSFCIGGNAAKSRRQIERTAAACREEGSKGFCNRRACDEDRSHNHLGQSASDRLQQRLGARKIRESPHIKHEHAHWQLMNRDGVLAISRVWQQVI